MVIRICDTVQDSIVDGPGLRFTVFFQGCKLGCPGCHNPGTHDINGGTLTSVERLFAQIQKNPLLKGISLSGGEPFLQAQGAAELALLAADSGLNVWCFTGMTWEQLTADGAPPEWGELLAHVDVLKDGPFVLSKRTLELPWRGSTNQRLIDVKRSLASGTAVEFN